MNHPTDSELQNQLSDYLWTLYSGYFKPQQQTVLKKAIRQKSDHFEIQAVGKYTHRAQLKEYFHERTGGYPKDYTIIKPRAPNGQMITQIVVPKGCIVPPDNIRASN